MNVVTVSEDYLPDIGGIASHVFGLSAALVRGGHRVSIITRRRDVPAMRNVRHWRARSYEEGGTAVTALPIVYSPRNVLRPLQFSTRFALAAAARLVADTDRILTYHHYLYDFYAVRRLRSVSPIVFTNHSSQFLATVSKGVEGNHSVLGRFAFADQVITPSRLLESATIEMGYPSERINYIPNGVDTSRFTPDVAAKSEVCAQLGLDSAFPLVLCASSPFEVKGIVYLIDALGRIATSGTRVNLIYAGMTSEQQPDEYAYTTRCRNALLALPQNVSVRILGGVPNTTMPRLHAAADCLVLPSLVEATSIAALESLASGTPVVGSRVGGVPEIVQDGHNGLLVPPRDPEALAAALGRMLSDSALRHRLRAAARPSVADAFGWDGIAVRTVHVYRKAQAGWIRERERRWSWRKMGA